ncbi:hypothetical protein GW17_00052351, partial [Ensete ventricosum]
TPLNPELCSPVTPSHRRREKALEQEPEILLGCAAALPLFPQPLTVGAPLPVRPLHQGQDSLQRPPPPPAAAPLVLLCRGAASESAADREGGHGNPLDHGNSPPLVLVKGVTEILLIAHVSAPLVSGRNWSVDGSCGAGYECVAVVVSVSVSLDLHMLSRTCSSVKKGSSSCSLHVIST